MWTGLLVLVLVLVLVWLELVHDAMLMLLTLLMGWLMFSSLLLLVYLA